MTGNTVIMCATQGWSSSRPTNPQWKAPLSKYLTVKRQNTVVFRIASQKERNRSKHIAILAILFRSQWKAMQRQMNLNGSVVEVTKIDKGQENLDQIGAGMQD